MAKTISFVATDKLAEWIEEESERRMTTVSSTAQQLLAEKYREEQAQEEGGEGDRPDSKCSEPEEEGASESGKSEEPDIFERHPEAWYKPKSQQHDYAVYLSDGDRKYYKTKRGAADRLQQEYE